VGLLCWCGCVGMMFYSNMCFLSLSLWRTWCMIVVEVFVGFEFVSWCLEVNGMLLICVLW